MISEKQLRNAAKEMNEVMGLDPEINPKASVAVLKEEIAKNMADVEEGDEFSEETLEVFEELKPKKAKGKKVEEPEEEEEEETEETKEEEEEDDDLRSQVEDAEKIATLKTLVKENSIFKPLREDLAGYKDIEDLRDEMNELLDASEQEEKAEKLSKKNIGNKKVNEVKKGKVQEEEEEEEKPKAKDKKKGNPAPNFKKEGSMAQFMDEVAKEGGSWEEIHKAIEKEAKKRGVKTSLATIKAHIKFRLSKDAKFLGKMKVREDGIS